MNVTDESKVGQIAAEHPLATRVFARHGIDFCCGGGQPLGDVCTARGLDTAAVLTEIQRFADAGCTDFCPVEFAVSEEEGAATRALLKSLL